MAATDFKALTFSQVAHGELRPPIFDGDHTYGQDYVAGRLTSLHASRDAIVFTVAFEPGRDSSADDQRCFAEVEFLVATTKKRLVGKITRQQPGDFCWTLARKGEFEVLDGLGTGSGLGGRPAANFFCMHKGFGAHQFVVSAYFKRGWLGGWREIIIKTPKKSLYVAYP